MIYNWLVKRRDEKSKLRIPNIDKPSPADCSRPTRPGLLCARSPGDRDRSANSLCILCDYRASNKSMTKGVPIAPATHNCTKKHESNDGGTLFA